MNMNACLSSSVWDKLVLVILLVLLSLTSFTKGFEDNDESEPTKCRKGAREARQPDELCRRHVDYEEQAKQVLLSLEVKALMAQESLHHFSRYYPQQPEPIRALRRYAELPFPTPGGPMMYFLAIFIVMACWYLKKCIWEYLHQTAAQIELHPRINQFPDLKLYDLQQAKREARLRRENRNTWAWLAKKYLLMQNDPKVNIEVLSTTWSDFELPKDIWGIVRAVMKVNALFHRTKKNNAEGKPNTDVKKGNNPEHPENKLQPTNKKQTLEAPTGGEDKHNHITITRPTDPDVKPGNKRT